MLQQQERERKGEAKTEREGERKGEAKREREGERKGEAKRERERGRERIITSKHQPIDNQQMRS